MDVSDAVQEIADTLIKRYPQLGSCEESIRQAYKILLDCYVSKHKLLIAGNGGSAADSDHISGELNKSFMFKRRIDSVLEESLICKYGEEGKLISSKLEGALPAIPLTCFSASNTAYSNDVDSEFMFAQLINSLGVEGDVFFAISTSGNSKNVVNAIKVAKAKGMRCIGLTGKTGGKFKELCDISICVPESETFKIQELHLPIYHAICSMVECKLFA